MSRLPTLCAARGGFLAMFIHRHARWCGSAKVGEGTRRHTGAPQLWTFSTVLCCPPHSSAPLLCIGVAPSLSPSCGERGASFPTNRFSTFLYSAVIAAQSKMRETREKLNRTRLGCAFDRPFKVPLLCFKNYSVHAEGRSSGAENTARGHATFTRPPLQRPAKLHLTVVAIVSAAPRSKLRR